MKCQKPLIWCGLGILGCFYLHGIYLVQHPRVSEHYRLYYMERKLLNWSHGAGLSYRLGDVIDFTQPVPYLSRKGWSNPEPCGTWSQGRASEMYLQIVDGKEPQRLIISGHPFVSPEHGLTSQRLEVYVNGVKIGSQVFAAEVRAVFEIPRVALRAHDEILSLRFEYSDPKSPKDLGLSHDDRLKALCLKQVVMD